jgi:hypothetical protein
VPLSWIGPGATVHVVADTDALWGGYVRDLRVDLTARRVTVVVSVTNGGHERTFRLLLTGVRAVQVERPDGDWERTELTELHSSAVDGLTRVELIFWTEPNGLIATCEALSVEAD